MLQVQTPILTGSVSKDGKRSFVAALPVINDSSGFTPIGATGQLRNLENRRVVAEFRLEDRNLMPGTRRRLSFLTPNLPDGRYSLSFRAVVGQKSLPPVSSDFVVQRGLVNPIGEAASLSLAPVTVQPGSISGQIPAGGTRTFNLRITNTASRPMALEIQPRSVEQSPSGIIGIGGLELAKGLNVEVTADSTPLSPGETRTIRLRAGLDAGATGDHWFALAIQERGNGLSLAETVYATITVPGKASPALAVESPKLLTDGATPVAVRFLVRNSGNVSLRPEPSSAVLEGGVRLVERPTTPIVGDGGMLPGSVVENTIMIPQGLKPGDYVLEISYQYGEKDYARLRVPLKFSTPQPSRAKRGAK